MVERTFPDGLHIPVDATGANALGKVVDTNGEQGVAWVSSYVSAGKQGTRSWRRIFITEQLLSSY